MKTKELLAEDLWPLVSKLSPSERARLARLALGENRQDPRSPTERYPLRGQPIVYHGPTEPVAAEDWNALE